MDRGATRYFVSVIREFAQSIGKENFFLLGEITGGRKRAYETLELTGLSAALGIDDIPDKLEYLVKGYRNPNDYFSLFRNSELVNKGSHIWFRNKVVTSFDDHEFPASTTAANSALMGGEGAIATSGSPCSAVNLERSEPGGCISLMKTIRCTENSPKCWKYGEKTSSCVVVANTCARFRPPMMESASACRRW